MSRPMGLLEQAKDVDDMLGELQVETDYRAIVNSTPQHLSLRVFNINDYS